MKYQRKKQLTRRALKMEYDKSYFVHSLGNVFKGEKIDDKKDPAMLWPVLDLDDGHEKYIVCGTLLQRALEENDHVGKNFEVIKHAPEQDKEYSTYSVYEIQVDKDGEDDGPF